MASRTTTDPLEILIEMGIDLDNLSDEEDYLSALMEAAATIEFQTKGSGDDRSAALRKEIIAVRKKRKAADKKFSAKTAKISKSSFKPKQAPKQKALPSSALVPYRSPEKENTSEEEGGNKKVKNKVAKSDKSENILSNILKNLSAIKNILNDRLKLTKSIRDIERKNLQKKKRKDKEDRLEADKQGKGFLKKLKGGLPQLNIFDAIFNWIKNVILGKILIKIIDWMSDKENKKKLEKLGKFLKDWWPTLTAAFLLFVTPLGGFVRTIVGGMVKLTAFLVKTAIPTLVRLIAKNPIAAVLATLAGAGAAIGIGALANQEQEPIPGDTDTDISSRLDNILGAGGYSGGGQALFPKSIGTDTIPAMLSPGEFVMSRGAVDKFGSNFMESINAAGGGTNRPVFKDGTVYASGGGSLIAKDAKTTMYKPSLGGINASGAKVQSGPDKGLPQTSTGEAYKPDVFSAAAFPPLIRLLPSNMTQATRDPNWGGIGKTIKKPFKVLVTNKDGRSAVMKVNDVGPGVAGHAPNHMLDFGEAVDKYLGTGTGFEIHMAKDDAKLGPVSANDDKASMLASFKGRMRMALNEFTKIPPYSETKNNNKGYKKGDRVRGYPGAGRTVKEWDGTKWVDYAMGDLDGTPARTSNNNSTTTVRSTSNSSSSSNSSLGANIDFSSLSPSDAFGDIFAAARGSITFNNNGSSSTDINLDPTTNISLDPTQNLKDLPGGMDANMLARDIAKSVGMNAEQTEKLAIGAVKLAKKKGRAPTREEIMSMTSGIVSRPNTAQLIPLSITTSATEQLKNNPSGSNLETITLPSIPMGASPSHTVQKGAVNEEPDFPTVSSDQHARSIRVFVHRNTLGGDS